MLETRKIVRSEKVRELYTRNQRNPEGQRTGKEYNRHMVREDRSKEKDGTHSLVKLR